MTFDFMELLEFVIHEIHFWEKSTKFQVVLKYLLDQFLEYCPIDFE